MTSAKPMLMALVVSVLPTACLFDGKLKHDFGVVPEVLSDGWEIGTPESVGLSSAKLAAIHAELLRENRFVGSLGMLVVKDGKIVWETYLRTPDDRDRHHALQSVTKSFTSLAFGIARDEGRFPSLDETVAEIFPAETAGLDAERRAITLRHLLTMTSGIDFDNSVFSVEMWVDRPSQPLRYILEKDRYAKPGVEFRYRDADPQIVAYAIERRVGATERAFLAQRMFVPLGIHDWYWEAGSDGVTHGAHSLHLRPRDLAKVGQLVLDEGKWKGRTIVSREWIDAMTTKQIDSTTTRADGSLFGYGFYWWLFPGGYAGWGHGGQYLVVVPSKRMVIVHISLPYTADMHGSSLREFEQLVAPLIWW